MILDDIALGELQKEIREWFSDWSDNRLFDLSIRSPPSQKHAGVLTEWPRTQVQWVL